MFLISEILSVAAEAADVCLPAAGGQRALAIRILRSHTCI